MDTIHRDGQVPLLFTPVTLRGVTARNRVVVSPMCQYRSVDGGPTDWHLVHLGKFGMGGAGIVFGDETAIEPRGRKTHACAGLYDATHVAAYRRINDFLRSVGAVPAIQLGHSGRKASCHGAMRDWAPLQPADAADGLPPWTGIAPSAVPLGPGAHVPHALDTAEIVAHVAAWALAAARAAEAGYDVCEIHGAHGYLVHQFLSPVTNRRTDAYGGGREGRMRFAFEITQAVRAAWPADRPLFFRVSAVDGKGGAWDMDDTVALAQGLRDRGVDVIDCSSGGIQGDTAFPMVPRVPGYHVGYSARIRREAGIATAAVGLITDPRHAEAILDRGEADLIALARGVMHQCDWPVHAAAALGMPGHFDLFPPDYAHRLHGRERSRSGYGPEFPTAIPHAIGDERPYTWPSPSAPVSPPGQAV